MIAGFKEFLMRGSVVDLAVAVVIGLAFESIIAAFTDNVIYPIVNVFGGADADGLSWQITANENTTIDVGAVITALVHFLIVAFAVYFFVVLPINKVKEWRGVAEEEAEENILLLREIRDLLTTSAATPDSTTDARSGHPDSPDSGGGLHRADNDEPLP